MITLNIKRKGLWLFVPSSFVIFFMSLIYRLSQNCQLKIKPVFLFSLALSFSFYSNANECATAISVSCGTSTVSGSTISGTSSGLGTCITGASSSGADWYTFTGDGATWVAETVAPSDYDTKIWVYSGSCGSLTCVTGNDDYVGLLSRVSFATTIGTTYYIIIGGYHTDEGNYDMQITSTCPSSTAPGGVSTNLSLWLKANEGVTGTTNVSSWADQSTNGNNAIQGTSSRQPSKTNNAVNYNPSITFNGTTDFLDVPYASELNTGNFTVFSIHKVSGGSGYRSPFTSRHDVGPTYGYIAYVAPNGQYNFWNGRATTGWENLNTGTSNSGSYEILELSAEQSGGSIIKNVYLDANLIGGPTTHTFSANTSQPYRVGAGATEGSSGNYFWNGEIAEQIVYSGLLSSIEKEKIMTYLCAKYGITKNTTDDLSTSSIDERDHFASDETIIWDYSSNSAHSNDIIGIGRDDNTEFNQKQSRTTNDSTRIFISTLATDNASNTGSFSSDISYLIAGHNNGLLKGITSEQPAGIYSRLDREWQITNNNFSEDFSIEIELEAGTGNISLSDLRLLVDADGDFSNATIYASPDVTFAFGSIIISGIGTNEIPLNSTQFITLASVSIDTPLPIELLSFNATSALDKSTILEWKTTSEVNNDFFTIERSEDAINWIPLMKVDGSGNSSSPLSYSAIDEQPYSGTSYYRLKQTDFDGHYSYSSIRSITIKNNPSYEVYVYPNPSKNLITVESIKSELTLIRIYDIFGQDVTYLTKNTHHDDTQTGIDISDLVTGVYYIQTRSKKTKFLKQ